MLNESQGVKGDGDVVKLLNGSTFPDPALQLLVQYIATYIALATQNGRNQLYYKNIVMLK